MNIEDKIEELKKEHAALGEKIAALKAEGTDRKWPTGILYYLDFDGDIMSGDFDEKIYEKLKQKMFSIGNCFRTQAEAEIHVRNLKIHQRLKELAGDWGWKPGDAYEAIVFDEVNAKIAVGGFKLLVLTVVRFNLGTAQAAIDTINKEFGPDALKEYCGAVG